MKKHVLFAASVMTILLVSSCKKGDDSSNSSGSSTPPKPKTKAELLMDGKWLEVDAKDKGTSIWSQVPECNKDDLMTFKTGGVVEYDAGANKCKSTDPQTRTGTWQLTQSDIFLKMGDFEYQIQQLDDKNLRLLYVNSDWQINLETIYVKK